MSSHADKASCNEDLCNKQSLDKQTLDQQTLDKQLFDKQFDEQVLNNQFTLADDEIQEPHRCLRVIETDQYLATIFFTANDFFNGNVKKEIEELIREGFSSLSHPLKASEYFTVMNKIMYQWEELSSRIQSYLSHGDNIEAKKIGQEFLQLLSSKMREQFIDQTLYKKTKEAFAQLTKEITNSSTKESSTKESSTKDSDRNNSLVIFAKNIITMMEEGGGNLTGEARTNFLTTIEALDKAKLEFIGNIRDAINGIVVQEEALTGLSNAQKEQLKKERDGSYFLGVDYATYGLIMKYCTNREIRKQLYEKFTQRGWPNNEAIIETIRKKNEEIAQMLNFPSFVFQTLKDQMAENISNVTLFLETVREKIAAQVQRENDMFLEYARKKHSFTLAPYDVAFVSNEYSEEMIQLNQTAIASFFPAEKVIKKMLALVKKIFGITCTMRKIDRTIPWAWSDDLFLITFINDTGIPYGHVVLDLYPRAYKYTNGCIQMVVSAHETIQGSLTVPVAVINANFTRPTADHDALLLLREVETLFHEFGHCLKFMEGVQRYVTLDGAEVPYDISEIFSQCFELFLEYPFFLRELSSHYLTGKQLPAEEIKKIKIANTLWRASGTGGSIKNSFFFLWLFSTTTPVLALKKRMHALLPTMFPFDPDNHWECGVVHIPHYGPSMYSYLWTLGCAYLLLTAFEKHNFSQEIGKKYRAILLQSGTEEDYFDLLSEFLGRTITAEDIGTILVEKSMTTEKK